LISFHFLHKRPIKVNFNKRIAAAWQQSFFSSFICASKLPYNNEIDDDAFGSNELSGGEGIFLMDQMNFCVGRGKITMKISEPTRS
jgi:hypothetical protein